MKQLYKLCLTWLAVAFVLFLSSCGNDDPGPQLTGDNEEFPLAAVSNASITGTVTFAERDDGKTLITIQLSGTSAGGSHPAHIHATTAAQGGAIILDLTSVDGGTGKSETAVDMLNDGTPITYEELIAYNGYVNVHASATDLATLIAQGDVGQNSLTGDSKAYTLASVSNPAISGTVTFEKRQNGQALVTVSLAGTTAGNSHPSHIHANSAAQGGGILIDLTNIDGTTGKSKTNVSKRNSGDPITYDELMDFNGYVNVHLSSTSLGTLIAQGDIGQNELTGVNKVYTLNAVASSGVSGTVTFAKRKNGFTLATVILTGTTAGNTHPSHIHNGNVAAPGGIAKDFTNINGTTGRSATNIAALNNTAGGNNGQAITYDQLLTFNGYVNVHLSSTQLGTLIAQGNIGSNAP